VGKSILRDITILDFYAVVDALDGGIIVLNSKGDVIIWNEWMSRFSSIDKETVIGKPLEAIFENLDNRLRNGVDDALNRGLSAFLSERLLRRPLPLYVDRQAQRTGKMINQTIQVKPCMLGSERLVVIQVSDVSKSIFRETALRQQSYELKNLATLASDKESQIQTILDNVKDAILILDANGDICGFYHSAQRMFGYLEKDIIGKAFSVLLPFPFSQQYAEMFKNQAGEVSLDIRSEAAALRSDGELFYTEMALRAISENGVSQYVVTISDISDRKQVQDALHQEKEQAQVTLSSIADGVITTDIIGRINFINPAALKLIGRNSSEVLNHRIDLVVIIESERARLPVFECIESGVQVESLSGDLLYNDTGQSLIIHQVASPIHNQQGDTIGAVMIFRDVSKSHRLANRLSWQASHDDLTQLFNRRELERHLQHVMDSAINENVEHCLVYMDLDKFKVVNDTCGHAAGDELLKQLTEIFRANVRGADTLARLGGDEFAFILTRCGLEPAKAIADKIRAEVEEFRFGWGETFFQVGVSMGLVVIDSHCPSLTDIFKAADSACYAAKEAGRNRIHVYNPDDREIVQRQGEAQWMIRIQRALEENRFELCYQPIVPVDESSNASTHFEILVRMISENGETIPPGAFIPSAERYHMMSRIDLWVIEHLFQWLAQYNDSGQLGIFAINLSGQTMADNEFQAKIKSMIQASQINPKSICFEITETAAISNLSLARGFITDLKGIGCQFALDDFGSGLSSFAYLKNLPVDYLKIDGAFVKDMTHDAIDRAMVESIHRIGNVMNLKTIAEFVENNEILDALKEVGVDYAQGYGIAHPKPLPKDKYSLL